MQQLNKRATTTKAVLFLIALMVLPITFVLAGPRDLGGDPSGAPIDGGISLLVAAGIGYGAKKARDARKQKKTQAEENKSGL